MNWACKESDVFLKHTTLEGEGIWIDSYLFIDPETGEEYEVWVDQEGESKVVCL